MRDIRAYSIQKFLAQILHFRPFRGLLFLLEVAEAPPNSLLSRRPTARPEKQLNNPPPPPKKKQSRPPGKSAAAWNILFGKCFCDQNL
jgi:hypothetical protein